MTQSLWTDEWAQLPVLAAAGLALLVGLLGGALIALARHRRHGEVLLALKTRLAVAEDQAGRLPRLEQELARKSERLGLLQAECAELKARLEHERAQTEEKLAVLRNAEAQLFAHFDSLAQRILDEKTRKFTEHNRTQLDGLLTPFREQLADFRRKVDELHLHDAKDRASLRQEIEHLRQQTQRINQEAVNLTRALKGDKKLQGNWGEMVLERVLEQSGLRRNIDYRLQSSFRDGEQRLFRPDVVVHLPEGRDIVIDAKVSLVAYERSCTLEDGPEREAALRDHVQAVRNHIKSLARKDYAALMGLRTVDFILLFMPIEAAFLLAFQQDEQLFSEALAHHVVVVTPSTLLATLRTVENIWRYERRNENAKLIADKAAAIYDKLRGFVEDLEKLGVQLQGAQRTYDEAMGKLTRGRGNLVQQAHSFAALGVRIGKPLPKGILEQADLETDPVEVPPEGEGMRPAAHDAPQRNTPPGAAPRRAAPTSEP
ncbi:DNA recombination protein RmuC [Candidatus Methylocalor cossyra]|uniref:DNA recombination protein RmuC n=1 Tax=Candidatus Methylocalor cossyra TaxID=3108543 RepID=A0ABP1C612_9GAMM